MDLGRVMGIGRWGIIGGLLLTSLAFVLNAPILAWTGTAVVGLGLVVNTAGKFVRYGRLSIPTGERLAVMGAWLLLVLTIGGLVVDYTASRLVPGYRGRFWALVIGAAGFAAIYWGLRLRFVPGEPD